jgi:hypothetical protein
METYSISVRLQRITTEECYVQVPVTGAVMQERAGDDATVRLDPEKLFQAAVWLGQEASDWSPESQEISVHPVQKAPDAR